MTTDSQPPKSPPAQPPKPESSGDGFWAGLPAGLRKYVVFCLLVTAAMAYANHRGYFPTYGIFSGENSIHSSYHSGYHGGYGIHGK